jgi:hypothetical protein
MDHSEFNPSTRASRPLLWLGNAAAVFLGLVLLVAAWAKAIDPLGFREQIEHEGLAFLLPAGAIVLIALFLETSLGVALVLAVRRLWILIPTVLLVAFFVALTARGYWLATHGGADAASGCGCFGNLVQRSPAAAFWQDTLLLVPALLLTFVGRPTGGNVRWRAVLAGLLGLAAVVLAWKAPELPLDDLATRLHTGTTIQSVCLPGNHPVCLGDVSPELRTGKHLVVMADLDDPRFTQSVDALNTYTRGASHEEVTVLTASAADRQRAFFWKWAPAFSIVETPASLLRPLYRQLPRAFRVADGRVVATFPGLPSLGAGTGH